MRIKKKKNDFEFQRKKTPQNYDLYLDCELETTLLKHSRTIIYTQK